MFISWFLKFEDTETLIRFRNTIDLLVNFDLDQLEFSCLCFEDHWTGNLLCTTWFWFRGVLVNKRLKCKQRIYRSCVVAVLIQTCSNFSLQSGQIAITFHICLIYKLDLLNIKNGLALLVSTKYYSVKNCAK